MKNLITKSIFTFALLLAFSFWWSYAIDVINTWYSNNCDTNQSITRNYYLTNNGYVTNPSDQFTAIGSDALLFSGWTIVWLWRNGVIAQNSCNTWLRSSNVAKQWISNTLAIFNDDGCRFNIPNYTKTNSAAIDAQIQYTIAYRNTPWSPSVWQVSNKFYFRTGWSSYWTCYPWWEHKDNRQDCPNVTLNVWELRTHVWECINYRIFRCGDWLLNGYNWSTQYDHWTSAEECDPNLPSSIPNWYTCNSSCQLVQNTPNPQCNSQYNWQTQYTNTTWFPWLNSWTPGLCLEWNVTNFTGRWQGFGHTAHYTWSCSNSAWSTWCSVNQNWCGDGKVTNNEACDPNDPNHAGWNNNGYTCNSSCQLVPDPNQQPQCNSQYNWQTQYTNTTWFPWLNSWTPGLCLEWNVTNFTGRWQGFGHTAHYTWSCSNSAWSTWCSVNQNWCGDGKVTNNEACDPNDPNHAGWNNNGYTCNSSCQLIPPQWEPIPYLLKQQKTWGMANFTSNQINVEIWETITYKVNFGNSWTVAATWEVRDILPPCTNYLTSSIVLPNGVTYNWPITWPYWSQYMVKYKDFLLQPGQGWYMLIQAQIRWTGTDWTTSCSNVRTYVNTWYFKFVWGNTLNSQVVAVRPEAPGQPHLTILKELLTAWDMTAWSTVVYKITLTNDWNATYNNAYILDILPSAIQYQTSSIQNITNYLFEEWTTWNNEYFIRYYNFNLNAGQSAIVYLTWILREWFNFNQTTNCAFTSGDDSCVLFPLTPIPYVKKWQKVWNMDYTDEIIQVQLWDTIRYKVDFANLWNSSATGQVKDVLPPCVKYVSSSIHWVEPYQWPIIGQQWVQDVVLYKNFPMAAWQTWYMLVEAEIKESWILWVNCSDTRSYLNTWYFKFTRDTNWLSDDVLAIREESAGSEVIFDKTWNKKLMHPGEGGLEFYITVTNKGPNPISNVYVDENYGRPDEDCIIYEWRTGDESLIEYIDPLTWHYIWVQGAKTNYNIPWEPSSTHPKGTLYAWQSFSFIIFASVANNPACVWYYINTWRLTYTEWGQQHTLYDDYDFEVIDDNPEYACESIVSSGSIVELGTNNQWHMRFTCTASDSKPHTIYIDCGNGRWETWYNTSSFSYNCTYWEADEWSSLVATCLVDGEEPTNPACTKKIWINPGLYWDCGNGIIEAWEDCDLWSARWVSEIITDYLDAAWTIRAWQFEWNYCKNCKIITGSNFVYEPAECLHSDTPISVMENETMPFWWRLRIKDDQRLVGKNGCYQDSTYATSEKVSSNNQTSLSPWDKDTILWKDEMYCRFSVYNWSNKLQWNNWNSTISFKLPCFEGENSFNTLPIYQYFINHHMTKADWASFATAKALMWWSKNYWEYKLVLEKVEYQYCDKTVWQWKPWKRYGAVCEVDFAITKPYMMQVSTFGVNPVATNGEKFLDDYYDMNWKKIIDSTDLKETINTENSNYAVSSDARYQMDTFKEKYGKLAVKINRNTLSSIWLDVSNINSVSKVPNQSIYFIEWNWTLRISQKNLNNKTSAYTLIVEWMDVEVVWDMFVYAMIVADHIKFTDAWGSKEARCAEWWQVVQWIFVALKWFEQWPSLVNTNENTKRCARWGLHVKWVLIWSNISNLMNGRRSQLNSWFNVNYVWWSDQKIRTDRKKKIMEGAALLIEYNPSLWKTLPPWADIFTESLEVYKK